MEMYKEASRTELRFETSLGNLSTEKVWDLTLNQLSGLIKKINRVINQEEGGDALSFLGETKVVDKVNELRFNILKDIYTTKRDEDDALRKSMLDRDHNKKTMARIAALEDKEMDSLSKEDLLKQLR